jgi:capsular polysaccharide biosynthesis protein
MLTGARESVSAPALDARQSVSLAALCGLVVAWMLRRLVSRLDRRVVDARDLAQIAGLAVFGVLNNADTRSARGAREATRPLAPLGAIPALP